ARGRSTLLVRGGERVRHPLDRSSNRATREPGCQSALASPHSGAGQGKRVNWSTTIFPKEPRNDCDCPPGIYQIVDQQNGPGRQLSSDLVGAYQVPQLLRAVCHCFLLRPFSRLSQHGNEWQSKSIGE